MNERITSPDSDALSRLCERLHAHAAQLDRPGAWPGDPLKWCAEAGVYEWFIPAERGGQGWSDGDIYRAYLQLAGACLTTTFVITQYMGACRRIAGGASDEARQRFLEPAVRGELFATVGISHLTTSRRHLAKPVLAARQDGDEIVLDGMSPWVTGSPHADVVVLGAVMEDGRELLLAAPCDLPGVTAPPPAELVGLSASCTGALRCDNVRVPSSLLLAGPVENVMQSGKGAGTGGLQTSVLALGLASAAIEFVTGESAARKELREPAEAMRDQLQRLSVELLAAADGQASCDLQNMRIQANSLVLRASQAALTAAKGAGYVQGHPAGRWCREALFFLVWSCPQPVLNANLCELAGIQE